MLTVSARLTPAQARAVSRAADELQVSHEELTRRAVLLFVRAGGKKLKKRKPTR